MWDPPILVDEKGMSEMGMNLECRSGKIVEWWRRKRRLIRRRVYDWRLPFGERKDPLLDKSSNGGNNI